MKILIILSIFVSLPVFSEGIIFESSEKQTKLLELFSTQSCSSCPPAQRWVNQLESHPELFKKFIPIVYHVDYWDYLGWKDPYSQAAFTKRQRQYAALWKSSTIYTPMFVLNGKEWRSRNRKHLVMNQIKVGVLKVELNNRNEMNISFSGNSKKPLTVQVAILSKRVTTKVKAGENSGKNLDQAFLVLSEKSYPFARKENDYQTKISLNKEDLENAGAIVAWVSEGRNAPPIQSTGGFLN